MSERISGYNPENALPNADRVNLDVVMDHMEATIEAGVDADLAVRQGLSALIRADLRNY